ncbi:Acyl-coenzyme A:6-aminopenicillanic acid acyl-transferase [Parapedobacter luteus]|uniref:Acyl-coenzyme A:6-aminopenicillanic acid acyl-transferase n=1 Tax=Parapedobacter luteus TaxID=623280 RepID=A0A1T5DV25_9SPHI|nr:C45 family peptidase [Parapedobacter luteus]SKB75406.1 Acyl-coenzyme A:6-aminopenicillanic acid acyl-transferase [Parapedobacter luteus]
MAKPIPYQRCIVIGCCLALAAASCAGVKQLPDVAAYRSEVGCREESSPDFYVMPQGKLRRNGQGIWELYVSGNALERGLTNGLLTRELLHQQETAFVSQVQELVPSRFRQRLLRGFLGFFNRQLADHVPEEYQVEIYGLSRSASDTFNFIAPPYQRLLYFHGAHDIGHALQDLALVGCTSFAAWGQRTADGKLLIGRNFDFYAGDEFAKEKMVAFIRPDSGFNHAMVTWAGMVGAVSGMNEKGLTVTINAGKSDMPLKAKTPISLLTREILQYAATIDEAIRIASRRQVFVSESILVASAADGMAVLIEVSPKKFGVFELENGEDLLVCANHFQSEPYQSDKNNLRQLAESHSKYRFDRMRELAATAPPLTPSSAAAILRNREGKEGIALGNGNEKAINQLLAHHGVIFQPADRLMWVSANPYQLGEFVAYQLDDVFRRASSTAKDTAWATNHLNIPEDPFVRSAEFRDYQAFRVQAGELEAAVAAGASVPDKALDELLRLNPEFWKANFLVGEYYFGRRQYAEALRYFRLAASKEVTTAPDRRLIEKRIKKSERAIGIKQPKLKR